MGLENPSHFIPLILLILLLFGAKRLPEIGRSLGHGMREFKDSITGVTKPELSAADDQPPQPPAATAAQAPAPPATAAPASAEPPAPAVPAEPQHQG